MDRAPYTYCASYAIFRREGEVLLARRRNTGFEDGKYSLPAGHTEAGETFTAAMIREIKEELGVSLKEEDLKIAHVMHRNSNGEREYVDTYFLIENWQSEPVNNEEDKCDDLSWFPIAKLPENIIPYVQQAITCAFREEFYSEYGWK